MSLYMLRAHNLCPVNISHDYRELWNKKDLNPWGWVWGRGWWGLRKSPEINEFNLRPEGWVTERLVGLSACEKKKERERMWRREGERGGTGGGQAKRTHVHRIHQTADWANSGRISGLAPFPDLTKILGRVKGGKFIRKRKVKAFSPCPINQSINQFPSLSATQNGKNTKLQSKHGAGALAQPPTLRNPAVPPHPRTSDSFSIKKWQQFLPQVL